MQYKKKRSKITKNSLVYTEMPLVGLLLPIHCRYGELEFRLIIFSEHTHSGTTLIKGSAGRRDLYLTIHNTHKRETSMASAQFEPAIPECKLPQTYALDRAATRMGYFVIL
jgi:hypothetical protein